MKFCPNCKSMVFPKRGKLKCRCGWEEEINEKDIEAEYKFEGKDLRTNEVIITDNNKTLPTTEITCYKCGGTKGYWWQVQTRSADEAPTFFIRCAKCGNTWRRSN
ncbi:MAG: transcription factor S [Methanobacteriaceae archaeon]|nr:transcription factor S [Methanobacteriaceae archaeon]